MIRVTRLVTVQPGNIVATTLTQVGEGWIRTNDIGYLDEDNFLFILGRANDLIVTRGYNIHPQEIEDCYKQISWRCGIVCCWAAR